MIRRLHKEAGLFNLQKRQTDKSSGSSNQSTRNLTSSHENRAPETEPPAHAAQKVYATHNDTKKAVSNKSSEHTPGDPPHRSGNSTGAHNQHDAKDEISSKNQTSYKESTSFGNQARFANQPTHSNTTATQSPFNSNSTVVDGSTSESDDATMLPKSNSSTADATVTLRDQSYSGNEDSAFPSTKLEPPTNSSSITSSLQTQEPSGPSDTYHKPSGAAICGIVFGIVGALIVIGVLAFYLKSYRKKHRHYRSHYHRRNHSSTDSNKAVRDRSSFVAQFGAHDPFAGPPEQTRTAVRRSNGFPCGDLLGFNMGKSPSRRPSYLNMYPPDIKPPISAPIIQHPPPLIHRSLSSHSAGVPVSCMSAVVKRMSSTVQNRPFPFRRESWTRDPYHRRGSVLSVKNPDIEDRITNDDEDGPEETTAEAKFNLIAPPSSDLHYQDLPVASTCDSHEPSGTRPPDQDYHVRVEGPYRTTPWGEADSQRLSNESSSFAPEHNSIDLDDDEPIFSGPEIVMRTQAAIDAHISHLSRSTRYSQDSEERLEVESPTDPAVRSATPTSLVFVSFGADRRSRWSERSRQSFQTVPLQ